MHEPGVSEARVPAAAGPAARGGAVAPPRVEVSPYAFADTARLTAELSCSHVLAQVLVRRGLRRAGRSARVPRRRRDAPALGLAGAGQDRVAGARARRPRVADHRPRRLRRRRRVLDGDPRAGAAHARRGRRLVPAEPDRRRLRPGARHRRAARRARHEPADHGRLRGDRGRGGRARPHARPGRRGHRPPLAARRRPAARRAARPPAGQRLPVRGPLRGGRRLQARPGAAGGRRGGPGAGRRGSGPGRARHRGRRRAAAGREPPPRAPGPEGAGGHAQGRDCGR